MYSGPIFTVWFPPRGLRPEQEDTEFMWAYYFQPLGGEVLLTGLNMESRMNLNIHLQSTDHAAE